MATRWGICSAGSISNDFCTALSTLPKSDHEVVAVAARSKESADKFAQKYGIPTSYGSYEELAKDSNVEIVYVGTIHPTHHAACMLFLGQGKHVLCEKPMSMSLAQCKEVIAFAKEKKLFFMEGFWTRFFPCVNALQEEIQSGSVGKINFLRCNFCVPGSTIPRLMNKELGGGGLLDPGCYPVQWANLIFRGQKPEKISVTGTVNDDGIDVGATLVLQYSGGATAILYYHLDNASGNNNLTVMGTKGNMEIAPPMHAPTRLILPSGEVKDFALPGDPSLTFTFHNSAGFAYEAQAVRECLQKGLLECPKMTHDDSINIMEIMDEGLRQLGVQY